MTTNDSKKNLSEEEKNSSIKKMPVGAVDLVFTSDILIPKCKDKEALHFFRRYEFLLEKIASYSKEDRYIKYKFIVGLILTSHAKKTLDKDLKKELFDLKNDIYLSIINDLNSRRKISIKYLSSKNFIVKSYCPECQKANDQASDIPNHKKKFCKNCQIDRNYYDVISIYHKFGEKSGFNLFLSKDRMNEIKHWKPKDKIPLTEPEGGVLGKYKYNISNMSAFNLDSTVKFARTLLELAPAEFDEKAYLEYKEKQKQEYQKQRQAKFQERGRRQGPRSGQGGGSNFKTQRKFHQKRDFSSSSSSSHPGSKGKPGSFQQRTYRPKPNKKTDT